MRQAVCIFVKAMEDRNCKRCINVQKTHDCFSITQTNPLQILYQLSTFYIQYALVGHAKHFPENLRKPHWPFQLDIFDACFLLMVDCGACSVKIKASNIQHDSVGCSVFSVQLFGSGEIVGYSNCL